MALDNATNHVTLPLGLYKLVFNGRSYIGSIQRGYGLGAYGDPLIFTKTPFFPRENYGLKNMLILV